MWDQRAGPGRARPGDTRADGRAPPPRRRGRRGVRGRHSPRHHVEASRADHRWVYGTGRERPPAPRRARRGPYATLEQNTGISTGSRSTRSASPRPVFSQEPEFVRTSTPNDRRRGAPTPCAGARAEIQNCIWPNAPVVVGLARSQVTGLGFFHSSAYSMHMELPMA